jgi:hypothetical protein
MIAIEMMPAERGDALLLEYGPDDAPTHRIVIDGGPVNSDVYTAIHRRLAEVEPDDDGRRRFPLLVITHIDTDHIEGAIRLLQDTTLRAVFEDIWFNGWKHLVAIDEASSVRVLGGVQGEFLGALLHAQGRPWNQLVNGDALFVPDDETEPLPSVTLPGGLVLTLLSPDRDALQRVRKEWKDHVEAAGFTAGKSADVLESLRGEWWARRPTLGDDAIEASDDTSMANRASIAFLAEYGGRSILLGADAHADVLTSSLRRLRTERGVAGPLEIDAIKLSHHGSKHNTTRQLLKELATSNYLISSNGARFGHPDSLTIKTIIEQHQRPGKPVLHLNYEQERLTNLATDQRLEVKIAAPSRLEFPTTP